MSMRDRGDRCLVVALTVLFLPARVLEEGAHAVAALPWAEEVFLRLDPRGDVVETVVKYPDETPEWAIRFVHVVPELLAAGSALAVIAWWTVGGSVWLPASTLDWILLWLVGAQYLAIAWPEHGVPEVGEP